jgi:hypothetical protein
VDSLHTTSANKRTGTSYIISFPTEPPGISPSGFYTVLTDNATHELSLAGDTVLFRAQNSLHLIERSYVFNTDDCHCHIHKVSGPDTIIVR